LLLLSFFFSASLGMDDANTCLLPNGMTFCTQVNYESPCGAEGDHLVKRIDDAAVTHVRAFLDTISTPLASNPSSSSSSSSDSLPSLPLPPPQGVSGGEDGEGEPGQGQGRAAGAAASSSPAASSQFEEVDPECSQAAKEFFCASVFPACGLRPCLLGKDSGSSMVCQEDCINMMAKCGRPVEACLNTDGSAFPSPPKCTHIPSVGRSVRCRVPSISLPFCQNADYEVHSSPDNPERGWSRLDAAASERYLATVQEGRDTHECRLMRKRLACSRSFLQCNSESKDNAIRPICRKVCEDAAKVCGDKDLAKLCKSSDIFTDDDDNCTEYTIVPESPWFAMVVGVSIAGFLILLMLVICQFSRVGVGSTGFSAEKRPGFRYDEDERVEELEIVEG
jgi:hypothetical protein